MLETLKKEVEKRLWPHQTQAIRFAIHQINSGGGACLIRMPTGTGKTGVIACLTMIANRTTSLVLTPWANLRVQMIDKLTHGFWEERRIKPNELAVVEMLPTSAKRVLESSKPQVIVATFATLNALRRDHRSTYELLAKKISLVVVDECHYEPAVEWGQSVKQLRAPMVLLTATPYRNDLKLFRITNPTRSTHHFTHKEAVRKKIIRTLAFEELLSPLSIPALSRSFAKFWRSAKRKGSLPSNQPRAIICCAHAEDIESAVRALQEEGLSAIGLHDRFEDSEADDLIRAVPRPEEEKAEIWVHQNKLTEGLDDHRFCCLAIFTPFRNDRKLIQQIGRILRHNGNDRPVPAIVVAPKEYSVESEWNAYLDFETNLRLLDPQHFRDVVDTLLRSQPDVEYFEGRFRRRFRPNELSENPQVIVPPSAVVRKALRGFSLGEYIENATDALNTKDAVILGPDLNGPCLTGHDFAVWVYASVRNSRYLQNTSLYEVKLETHCVVVTNDHVLIADSRGILPREYLEENTASVSREALIRFLDKKFRPTHVSVDNSIPYDTVLRGQDVRGYDLLRIPTSLTDRIQICRAARGTNENSERRYIGITNGRLRKEETLEERRSFGPLRFVDWARDVSRILRSQTPANPLFERYMPTCEPPDSPIPRTICIDLLRLNLSLTLSDGTPCCLQAPSADVQQIASNNHMSYECTLVVASRERKPEPLSLQLHYERSKCRFWFGKKKGPAIQVNQNDGDNSSKSLVDFLNQNQDIVLIGLEGGDIVYQDRNFYRIDYSHAEKALVELIRRPTGLQPYLTEKGSLKQIQAARRTGATNFSEQSIFRAIAENAPKFPFRADFLICADLGTECADFIAGSFDERELALIHAKAGSGEGISAKTFHEVVAQAMKNLAYLTRNAETPKGVGSWRSDRMWNRTQIPRLYRAPVASPEANALWSKIKTEILGASNPNLYAVLVTTGCCDIEKLREAVKNASKRTPEVAQLLHLLDGLNSFSRQLGVQLLIYDLPFAKPPKAKTAKRTKRVNAHR